MGFGGNNSMGKTYFIGNSSADLIKVDLFYTDPFVFPLIEYNELRLSGLEEIAAMKLEVVGHTGRKKDFWDLHELLEYFSIKEMLYFYEQRYPYGYTKETLIKQLTNFAQADDDFNPICLMEKYWELIKIDFEERTVAEFLKNY